MQFVWAFVIGLIFMVFLRLGVLGFFLGFIIGPMLYSLFNRIAPIRKEVDPALYLDITFEVLGHLSKVKGTVTRNDIKMATQFMDTLQLRGEARRMAQRSFNIGKACDYPLRQRLGELYLSYCNQRNILNLFCEHLIQAALSDGELHQLEQQILYVVADELHISKSRMSMYIQMIMASYHFHQQSEQYRHGQSYQRYNQPSYGKGPDINHAYQLLGVTAAADKTTIKRAYRKLMNEHHPDKLISKGLPKEMLEAAKQRAQEIQSAYDLIKGHHGFR